MRFAKIAASVLLVVAAGCLGKSNDQKSVDLIIENTPNMKLVHLPNDEVKKALAAKGITVNGAGCPQKFTRVPRGFYESDGTIKPACVPSFTNTSMPFEIDYTVSGEKTGVPPDQIAK